MFLVTSKSSQGIGLSYEVLFTLYILIRMIDFREKMLAWQSVEVTEDSSRVCALIRGDLAGLCAQWEISCMRKVL